LATTSNKFKFLILLCMFITALCIPVTKIDISADTTTDPQVILTSGAEEDPPLEEEDDSNTEIVIIPFDGLEVGEDVIIDKQLRSALLDIYKDAYDPTDPKYYDGSIIYSDMFKDFETLNLDEEGISSLNGLEKLELDNLTSLSLNQNDLTTFDDSMLENIDEDKFTTLSLASNQISSVKLTRLEHITYLDLSSNRLSSVDLSSIEGKTSGTSLSFNLANNNLDSISDIVFPSKRIGHIELNIISNNITDLTDTFFTDFYTLHVGVQGFKTSDKVVCVDTSKNVLIYPFNIPNLSIEITKTDGEEDELVATISDADIEDDFLKLNLSVGEYEFDYKLDGNDAYTNRDYARKFYTSGEFNVIPQKAKYIFTYKGKTYEELGKVTGKVTVTLSSVEEGAKIMYSVNGGEWKEGTEIKCEDGGSYSIKVKTIINGFESEEQSIWVRTSLNLYISDALMLVLVLLLALVLFLVVLPIVSKKYFKKD